MEEIPYPPHVTTIDVQVGRRRVLRVAEQPIPHSIQSDSDLACHDRRSSFQLSAGCSPSRVETLKQECRACPMQPECLEFGLHNDNDRNTFVFASTTRREREQIRRARRIVKSHQPQEQVVAPPGYPADELLLVLVSARRQEYMIPSVPQPPRKNYQNRGLCNANPQLFNAELIARPGRTNRTLRYCQDICEQCDVRVDCLEDALATPVNFQKRIRGGMTPKEREQLAKARQNATKHLAKLLIQLEEIKYDQPVDRITVTLSANRQIRLARQPIPISIKKEDDLVCAADKDEFYPSTMHGEPRFLALEKLRQRCRQCPMEAECLEFGLIQPGMHRRLFATTTQTDRIRIASSRNLLRLANNPEPTTIIPHNYTGPVEALSAGSGKTIYASPANTGYRSDWRNQALCLEMREHFESHDVITNNIVYAYGICNQCQVRGDCFERIMGLSDSGDPGGVWAGTTLSERRQLRQSRRGFQNPKSHH